jgi:hypothetical protein
MAEVVENQDKSGRIGKVRYVYASEDAGQGKGGGIGRRRMRMRMRRRGRMMVREEELGGRAC